MLFKVILVGLLVSHRVNSMRFEDSKRGTDNKKHCVKFERGGVSSQWSKLKRWFDWSAPLTGTSADVGSARTAMPDQLAQGSRRNRRPRLVGKPTPINITDAPWVISFKRFHYEDEYCSGTIVTEEHIITDALCIVHVYENAYNRATYSFFGGDSIYIRVGSSYLLSYGKIVYTKQLCVSYHFFKFGNYLDGRVGVITLTEKLKFGKYVQPLPLHPAMEVINSSLICNIAGYGGTSAEAIDIRSDTQLQRVDIYLFQHSDCYDELKKVNPTYPSELLCSYSVTPYRNAATCGGDLGDGLICKGKLLGVVSSNHSCGNILSLTGIYNSSYFTRVDSGYSRDFIDSIIKANGATRDSYNGFNNIAVLGFIASLKRLFCQ